MDAPLHEPLLEGDAASRQRRRHPAPSPPRRAMSAVERLVLTPVEKWRAHGRFPFKIGCHVALLLLTLLQMALLDAQNASYMRATHRNWAYFFLPPSQDVGVAPRFQRDLFTLNQTRDAVFFVRDAYVGIANASLANYEYQRDPIHSDELVRRIDMAVTTRRRDDPAQTVTRQYRVAASSHDTVGPFRLDMDPHDARRLMRALMSVHFALHIRDRQYGHFYDECFDWTVHVTLTRQEPYHHAPQLRARVEDARVQSCSTRSLWQALRHRFLWLHAVVAAITTVYLVLSARALLRSITLLQSVASPLSLAMRLRLLNRLQLVVCVALVLQLSSSLWSLASLKAHVPIRYSHRLLQASAQLLLWASLVGYLEHNREIYSIVLTLRWGAPRVLQFLVGVSPIFVGFALFGTVYFGTHVKLFGSLSASMTTLFAVLNGDVILDTVDALAVHGFGVSGKLYVFTFISLFVYVVLNLFIAIVEEAFFATRNARRRLDVVLTDPSAVATSTGDASSEMARVLLQLVHANERAARATTR